MNNKNVLMPAQIPRTTLAAGQTIYPDGFNWSIALVQGKYLNAPNSYTADGKFTYPSESVFKCPEGIDPDDARVGQRSALAP